MCLSCQIAVKPSHDGAATEHRVPCGHCKECDEVYQKAWSFRLRYELEFLARQHWNVCFCTLTYNDWNLPHYPLNLFKDPHDMREVMCFSRGDCESFIRALRSWLWREYRLSGRDAVRYMLTSEYGSHTKRSHYHLVLAVPPQVDCSRLFIKVHDLWEPNGHVFPRYFNGGRDSHGYNHKPFVVESATAAAKYISKYTTKDLYYNEFLQSKGLTQDSFHKTRQFRRCSQFHLQSRGLGKTALDGLSDAEKLEVLKNGYQFYGDDNFYTLPVYLKNKILYDNRYVYEVERPQCGQDGEDDIVFYRFHRLVRREANRFFIENFREIFDIKVLRYTEFFKQMSNLDEIKKRLQGFEVTNECSRIQYDLYLRAPMAYANLKRKWNVDDSDIAKVYLAYYGLPESRWIGARYEVQWANHYFDVFTYENIPKDDGFPIISEFDDFGYKDNSEYIHDVQFVLTQLFNAFFAVPVEYDEADRLQARIKDFFASLE